MVGKDKHLGPPLSFPCRGPLMMIATDFEAPEILQRQIAMWTVRDALEFTEPTIGDGSLQGREDDTGSVRLWKGG